MTMSEPRTGSEFPNKRFWAVLEERHPEECARRAMLMPFFWQRALPDLNLVITMFVAPTENCCGVFLGRNARVGAVGIAQRLRPFAEQLNRKLGLDPSISSDEFPFLSRWHVNCFAEDNWPAMVDWLVTEASRYERALRAIMQEAA
jgi:Outer membrane receptor for ferrienterochelin and colicins